ncbi:heme ABC exporter ATP-binding protein CcmA [Croceicoccus sp. F390]|uniref:Heme ABC exporter ATP-binding protein CcmA n=1 Tax=Croceicoccus esteveae TaxID=3075597 RepID=A0ABU2ZGE6_9SPHN|nr:heme ABC exporter ATP-binding protein CcmA [Croceicoccus sp. F390]MDT0575666.1 heme ABC exporter ATP-binding protein CcmA [Croceicoccus sp. F390]
MARRLANALPRIEPAWQDQGNPIGGQGMVPTRPETDPDHAAVPACDGTDALPQPGFGECRINASDLACRRGDRLLFARLSFAVQGGETLHLAGPNGVGKSSLIRILAGLLPPWAGNVARQGAVALLDERLALDMHQPLGRALEFWARCDLLEPQDMNRIASAAELDDLLDVPVRYLSTGQRRRAALARTLGRGAPIWLLDEPLNGLDARSVATMGGMMTKHCASGGICIIASHQMLPAPVTRRIDIADFLP